MNAKVFFNVVLLDTHYHFEDKNLLTPVLLCVRIFILLSIYLSYRKSLITKSSYLAEIKIVRCDFGVAFETIHKVNLRKSELHSKWDINFQLLCSFFL